MRLSGCFGCFKSRVWARLLLLLLLAGPGLSRAQAPNWNTLVEPAHSADNYIEVEATATDARGNVFLTGEFRGTMCFGGTLLHSAGNIDVFVAKWNTSRRRFEWALRAGGSNQDRSHAIVVQGSSIYIAGAFSSSQFDIGATFLRIRSNYGYDDMYVAKLTDEGSTGRFVWVQQAGSPDGDENALGLAVNGPNLYITGYFDSPQTCIGSTQLSNQRPSGSDMFVAKLLDEGTTGRFVWAQGGGGYANDDGSSIVAVGSNVYVAGGFAGYTDSYAVTVAGQCFSRVPHGSFVARFVDDGATGRLVWLQSLGDYNIVQALAVAGSSLYVAGNFSNAFTTLGTTVLRKALPPVSSVSPNAHSDVFVAKLVDNGPAATIVWATAAGGSSYDRPTAIAVTGSSVYITGEFASPTIRFGGIVLTTNLHPDATYFTKDLFVAKLMDEGKTGAFAWARQAGSIVSNDAAALALHGPTVYVAGTGHAKTNFDNNVVDGDDSPALLFTSLTDTARVAPVPQPSSGGLAALPYLGVWVQATVSPANASLTITDALGRVARQHSASVPTTGLYHRFDLTGLPAGVYVLHVQTGTATTVERLLLP